MTSTKRCPWCGDDPLYQQYHDQVWGVPVYDDQKLFEMLTLEGAQAGLSWITVLKKQANYSQAFEQFDVKRIARFSDKKLDKLLLDPGIIRNRLKVYSVRNNAREFIAMQQAFGSFSNYLWDFIDRKPIQNHWLSMADVPATTPVSDQISKDLKKRGFKFVGPTIIYAYMQAIGMVNDHTSDCFRHAELQ